MNKDELKRLRDLVAPYKITSGENFKLKSIDPDDTHGLSDLPKEEAIEYLRLGVEHLARLQDKLYAQDRWSILCVFQAMDAAGKDGTIKHVMSGINPQGCQVYSFKQPSNEELDHDYMWRYLRCMPERGRIGIFNRSYYEEVLVVRVHEKILAAQKIPGRLLSNSIWDERLHDINNIENYLNSNGIVVLKFFLHVSKEEQKKRFMARLDDPKKNWKFSMADVEERKFWDDYMKAYQDAIRVTATKKAPWFVVPANNKWFTRLVIAAAIVEAMELLDLQYPKLDKAQLEKLAGARAALLND